MPRIARVEIQWSENSAVPKRSFATLAAADAALADAFQREPRDERGGYDKTGFLVVWTDGKRHEGRADVRAVDVRTAVAAGGILRQHLGHVGTWLRDKSGTYEGLKPEQRADYQEWGVDLLRRLDAEPPLGTPRNLHEIPEDQLLPIGATAADLSVTLLPDPLAAVAELEDHFAVIRPAVKVWMGHGRTVPRTTNQDVTYAANWLSLALANDMPRLRDQTGRPHGVIWDRWSKTIEHVRRHLGTDPDATYRDNPQFWSGQVEHLAHKIEAALNGHQPRNSAASDDPERVQFRIRYRGPRDGVDYVTHQLAPDYLTALQHAATTLGFWPGVLSVHRHDGVKWRPA